MKYIFAIFGIIVLVIVGSVVLIPLTTGSSLLHKTFNADNVIYNYEWFKRQYNDVIAIQTKIVNAESSLNDYSKSLGDRSTWKSDDRQEYARLNQVVLGLRNQMSQMIAEYNARATMINRSIFQTGDLPTEITFQ